jgi:SAM-dependent methyltransferase
MRIIAETPRKLDRQDAHRKRLEAFPGFLKANEKEGRGILYTDTGTSYFITFGATFSDYCRRLEINLWQILEEHISKRKNPAVVTDIGCGRGEALKEIKKRYGKNVYTIGFELASLESHVGIDEIIIGDFESKSLSSNLESTVDLAVSDQVFHYFSDPFGRPLQKVKKMLRPGGMAYVDVFGCPLPTDFKELDISSNYRLTIAR